MGQPARLPSQKSGIPALPNVGVLHPLMQNDQKFGVVAHMRRGLFFRHSAISSTPRRRGPSRLQLCGFSAIYAYTV